MCRSPTEWIRHPWKPLKQEFGLKQRQFLLTGSVKTVALLDWISGLNRQILLITIEGSEAAGQDGETSKSMSIQWRSMTKWIMSPGMPKFGARTSEKPCNWPVATLCLRYEFIKLNRPTYTISLTGPSNPLLSEYQKARPSAPTLPLPVTLNWISTSHQSKLVGCFDHIIPFCDRNDGVIRTLSSLAIAFPEYSKNGTVPSWKY